MKKVLDPTLKLVVMGLKEVNYNNSNNNRDKIIFKENRILHKVFHMSVLKLRFSKKKISLQVVAKT